MRDKRGGEEGLVFLNILKINSSPESAPCTPSRLLPQDPHHTTLELS